MTPVCPQGKLTITDPLKYAEIKDGVIMSVGLQRSESLSQLTLCLHVITRLFM